jgi:hypothetical protein
MNIRALSAALAASAMLASCVLSFDTTLPGEQASGGDTDVVGETDGGVDSGDVPDAEVDGGACTADSECPASSVAQNAA